MIPVSAVIASAIEDAVGFRIDAMPLNPSLLFDLSAEHRAAGSGHRDRPEAGRRRIPGRHCRTTDRGTP